MNLPICPSRRSPWGRGRRVKAPAPRSRGKSGRGGATQRSEQLLYYYCALSSPFLIPSLLLLLHPPVSRLGGFVFASPCPGSRRGGGGVAVPDRMRPWLSRGALAFEIWAREPSPHAARCSGWPGPDAIGPEDKSMENGTKGCRCSAKATRDHGRLSPQRSQILNLLYILLSSGAWPA